MRRREHDTNRRGGKLEENQGSDPNGAFRVDGGATLGSDVVEPLRRADAFVCVGEAVELLSR